MYRWLGRCPKLSRWMRTASFASLSLLAGPSLFAWPPTEEASTRLNVVAVDAAVEQKACLAELGVARWHADGFRGRGVRVAVLDSGFRGYRDKLDRGLPKRVRTRSFRVDEDLEARDSQHGILCAEVLHAVAPDAEILLANWEPDCPESFLRALRWAKSEGVKVVTCSVIMPSWSDGEGGGPTHAALREILGAGAGADDMALFAAAGNLAQRHWSGPLEPDSLGYHQWKTGQRFNRLAPWGDERIAIELYGPNAPCIVQVHDRATGAMLEQAELKAEARTAALRFDVEPGRDYDIALRCPKGAPRDGHFHVVVLGGDLEHARSGGSIPFPGDGTNVFTMGAVDRDRHLLAYSSCGPNSTRPKPDFVAQVPFPSRCRNRPFTGTSAAAPQGAGLAALLLSRWPDATPTAIHGYLRESAVDLLAPGHDAETGFGLLRLP